MFKECTTQSKKETRLYDHEGYQLFEQKTPGMQNTTRKLCTTHVFQ